jgi:hypothetical protein
MTKEMIDNYKKQIRENRANTEDALKKKGPETAIQISEMEINEDDKVISESKDKCMVLDKEGDLINAQKNVLSENEDLPNCEDFEKENVVIRTI